MLEVFFYSYCWVEVKSKKLKENTHNLSFFFSLKKGLFTRQKKFISGRCEKSFIDFVVICTHELPYVTEMNIEEPNTYITLNYTQCKGKVNTVNSDHNRQFVNMT